jgi:flagellar basal body-associated protein FliL
MSSTPVQPFVEAPKKSNKIWLIVIIVLLLVCCVCVVGAGGAAVYFYQSGDLKIEDALGVDVDDLLEENLPDVSSEPQEASPQTSTESDESGQEAPAEEAPAEEAPDLLSNLFSVELGEEVSYPQCGYSFQKIPDYKFDEYGVKGESCNPGMIMTEPDAEVIDTDPSIMLFGEIGEDAQSTFDQVQKMIEEIKNGEKGSTISQETIKIDGKDAISITQELETGGFLMKNRMVFLMVTPTQYFQIYLRAPEEKFDELLPYFDAVVQSISFSEPQPLQK